MSIQNDIELARVGLGITSSFWDKEKAAAALLRLESGLLAWEALATWERADINRAVTVEPVTDIYLMCAGDGDDGATGNGGTPTEAALSLCESLGLTASQPI